MRRQLMSAGKYLFFEEPANKSGLIGGKVIAINSETREEISRVYKRFHTGKTDKFEVLAKLMYNLVPPEKEEEKDEVKTEEKELNNLDSEEESMVESISKESL